MARVYTSRHFTRRYVEDPFDDSERGWKSLADYHRPLSMKPSFSMPLWLLYMCVSGRDEPWRNWRGTTKHGPVRVMTLTERDDWLIAGAPNTTFSWDSRDYSAGYQPVKPLGSYFCANMLKAPFPVTLDEGLIAYAACSIGETEWVPFAPLINGRCSSEMLHLMNSFPHKPAYIVYEGHLFVWINIEHWEHVEPKVSYIYPQPYIELELFRAYRAYYELLVRELPMPYRGPVTWPDQCDPRFPLSTDPRGAHYGMWLYSGGLTYGEHAHGGGLSQNSVRNRRLNL